MNPKYLNIKEASQYLGFSVHTLYSWTRGQRRIPFIKKGGRVRFDRDELERWMKEDARNVVADGE